MKKKSLIISLILILFTISSCSVDKCDNYKKDKNEIDIDCGGYCIPCPSYANIYYENSTTVGEIGAQSNIFETYANMSNSINPNNNLNYILKMEITHIMESGDIIILSFFNETNLIGENCLNMGKYSISPPAPYNYANTSLDNVGSLYFQSASYLHPMYSFGKSDDFINLTFCDYENQKMAGNYSVTVENYDIGWGTREVLITGDFANVPYTK